MSLGERHARSGFQVALKGDCSFLISEFDHDID